MKEDLPDFRHFAPARCLLSSGRVRAVKPDAEPFFQPDSDLAAFSPAYCAAANAAAESSSSSTDALSQITTLAVSLRA